MNKCNITQIVILGSILAWIVYDIWVYIQLGNPSTISATIWHWGYIAPGFILLTGILLGHVFFEMHEPTIYPTDEDGKEIKDGGADGA